MGLNIQKRLNNFKKRSSVLYRSLDERSGGALGVIKRALQSFNEARAPQAAAGMAYYTFFSLFPLLLAIIAGGSFVLRNDQVYRETVQLVTEALPTSEGLIEQNLDRVLELRGPVGIIGLVSLLWSGSGAFAILADNVNAAWSETESRNLLEKRLVALGMVGSLVLLLALSLFSTAALNLLPRLEVPIAGDLSVYATPLWAIFSNLVPWVFTFLLFFGLYLWVPTTEVQWSAALVGAVVAALGWKLATETFTWYLSSGLARYELVYGSLGTIVALLFWIYVSSLITFFGAHLSAAAAQRL